MTENNSIHKSHDRFSSGRFCCPLDDILEYLLLETGRKYFLCVKHIFCFCPCIWMSFSFPFLDTYFIYFSKYLNDSSGSFMYLMNPKSTSMNLKMTNRHLNNIFIRMKNYFQNFNVYMSTNSYTTTTTGEKMLKKYNKQVIFWNLCKR